MHSRFVRIVLSCCVASLAALCAYVGVMEFILGGTGVFGYLWTLTFVVLALASAFDALMSLRP